MECVSTSTNSNNQDSLSSETLQGTHEEIVARVNSPEPQHYGDARTEESDFASADANHRSRKKQKVEANDYRAQIDRLQQYIAEVKERLVIPQHHSSHKGYKLGKSCIEAKQTAAIMRQKLAEHTHWLQRVSSLMETAPLFDYAVGDPKQDDQSEQARSANLLRSMDTPDEWRGESKGKPHPRLILDERLRAAVTICQANASRLLRDALRGAQSFQLSLEFESQGWTTSTGTLLNDNMGFSCHRVLPVGVSSKAKDVATALWNLVESDEIFRTFVPLVQDSIITYQETDCSLSCRVVQLSQEMNQQAVVTVEAISSTKDDDEQENSWEISMEAVHDHYLCTFVADASGDCVVQNTAPRVKLDLGLQMSKLNMHNKFLLGARVLNTDDGVDIFIAGSARFDLPCYCDPAFALLQHFVTHLPVFEVLHVTPLNENQDKPALDVL